MVVLRQDNDQPCLYLLQQVCLITDIIVYQGFKQNCYHLSDQVYVGVIVPEEVVIILWDSSINLPYWYIKDVAEEAYGGLITASCNILFKLVNEIAQFSFSLRVKPLVQKLFSENIELLIGSLEVIFDILYQLVILKLLVCLPELYRRDVVGLFKVLNQVVYKDGIFVCKHVVDIGFIEGFYLLNNLLEGENCEDPFFND